MKISKVLLVTGIAALALASVAAAATFNVNLTVGSTGADVSALQNALIAAGYSIPAISSGTATGYFGSQTKAAVMAYQSKNNIPNTGFVGPLTRASLNGGATATTGGTCPTGYTCTANNTVTPVCPVGYTCTVTGTGAVVPGATAGITTPGVAGSLDLSNGSFVGNGTSVNDGQEVDLGSIAAQTGASDMQVTSVSMDFNVRPWLYMDSLSIRDTSGKVIAQVSNLNSSMFTEITVGSDYRINIPVNVVLPKATRTIFVSHGVFATSNRLPQHVAVIQVQARSVDGTGVTLTSTWGPDTTAAVMYVAYAGSSSSSIIASIDPNAPNTATIQTNTGTTQTENVLLGVFDLKSQNVNATLQGLTVRVAVNTGAVGTVFSNIQLKSGSTLLNTGVATTTANAIADYTFSNFNLALPQNTPEAVSVYGTINGGVTGVVSSTTLIVNAANITGIDSSSNNLTLATTGTLAGPNLTFNLNGVSVSGLAWSIAPTAAGGNNNRYPAQTIYSGSVTITAGNNALYISSAGGTALTLATSSPTVGASLTGTFAAFSPLDGLKSYDNGGTTYYQIPSGTGRTFNFNGTLALSAASTSAAVLSNAGITSVNLNTDSALTAHIPYTTLLQGLNSDFHVAGAYLNGTN